MALPESQREKLLGELRTLQTRERRLVQSLQLALRVRDQEEINRLSSELADLLLRADVLREALGLPPDEWGSAP
jgi:hypothetical protein